MKFINLKGFIFIIFSIFILFFIYTKFLNKNSINVQENTDLKEENFTNSNIIKDIKYSSKDLKGNEYVILADEGEIDLENTNIIFLKDVVATVKLNKNNEKINISSDFGKYNTLNYNTIFSRNVKVNYLENDITSNYLDFSMNKNLLIISKNVVYTNPQNILKADVVTLNTITKDTKIYMYNSNQKVEVSSK